MIPLNHLFETLVDHVISLFGDDLKDLAGEEIGYKIFDFLRDHNFQLEVNKKNETKRISGSSWIFKDQKIPNNLNNYLDFNFEGFIPFLIGV